jgi:Transglycosylase SLT domain
MGKLIIQISAIMMMFSIANVVGYDSILSNVSDVSEATLLSKPSGMELFLQAIAYRESKGNHRVVNPFGMMGKYQFSKTTLRLLRKDVSPNQFLRNPAIQDTVMIMYLKVNNEILDKFITRYDGKTFKGVSVTRSGVLAAAHLGGAGSVIAWFKNDSYTGLVDANGTSIREYMMTFANYPIHTYL